MTEGTRTQQPDVRGVRVLLLTTAVLAAALLTTVAAGAMSVNAQSFQEDINETFGSPAEGDTDKIQSVIQTRDGGFALAGETQSFGPGGEAAWLIKTDPNGNVEINETFGGQFFDNAESVIQTRDGGFALAGGTNSFGLEDSEDAWLIKTYANGTEEFNKTYRSGSIRANSVVQTDDGGYLLAGSTFPSGGGNPDALLVKTYANGTEQFNRTYGRENSSDEFDVDRFLSGVQTDDGGFAFGGLTQSFSEGVSSDAWLIKTNASGDVKINKTFGAAGIDFATSILQTPDDGYALAGNTQAFGSGRDDAWLIKTNSSGTEEFNKTYGGLDDESAESVVRTQDGGFALGGNTYSFGFGAETESRDAWLVKTDSNGNEQFNRTFGGKERDEWESLVQTNDDGFAFGGLTQSFGSGQDDVWLLKISPEEEADECIDRRSLSRGQVGQECPRDRTIERGGSREELDRRTGRRSDTSRRDRGRGDRRGRSR